MRTLKLKEIEWLVLALLILSFFPLILTKDNKIGQGDGCSQGSQEEMTQSLALLFHLIHLKQ